MLHVNVKSRAKLTKEKRNEVSWKLLVKWPSFIICISRKDRETRCPSPIATACELCSGLWCIVNYIHTQLLTVLQCFTATPHTITWYWYPGDPYHPWFGDTGGSDQKSTECHKNTALERDSQEVMPQWSKRSMSQSKLNCWQHSGRRRLKDTINKHLTMAF